MRDPAMGADLPSIGDLVGTIAVQALDVTDPDTFEMPVALRVLVNNAGVEGDNLPVEHTELGDWRRMFETNVFGLIEITHRALPVMRAGGGGVVLQCHLVVPARADAVLRGVSGEQGCGQSRSVSRCRPRCGLTA